MSWLASTADGGPDQAGEGITRTTDSGARLFPVRVEFHQGPAMTCTVRARDSRQALRFALNRHPNADPNRCRVIGSLEAKAIR